MVTTAGEVGTQFREDGRTERARRTRAAIVEAHLALMAEGDLRPSAQRIAERSGVSVRTLWMHFPDMESLFSAAAEAVLQSQVKSYRPIRADLPLEERIDLFCRQRARMMEKVAPYAEASSLREPFSPVLARYRARHVARVVGEVEQVFGDALLTRPADRKEQVDAIAAAATWGSWSVLRHHLGLGVPRARRTMARTVSALLQQVPSDGLEKEPR